MSKVEIVDVLELKSEKMETNEEMSEENMEIGQHSLDCEQSNTTGRKRQRSGSITPEEQSVRLENNINNIYGGDDRASLLLKVYLKMKLGEQKHVFIQLSC